MMILEDRTDRSRQAAILFAAIIGGILITALLFLLIYEIRGVLPPFIYASIIVYLFRPLVNRMVDSNIPRLVAVSTVYFVVMIVLVLIIIFVMPSITQQFGELIDNFPQYLEAGPSYFSRLRIAFYKIHLPSDIASLLGELATRARESALTIFSGLPETTIGIFGGVFNIILSPIIAFYVLKDLPAIKETLVGLFPGRYRKEILHVLKEIDSAVGGYLRGQVLISLVVGVTITIYLLVIGVNFAVLLGALVGILNIIPYFGPILGGAIAVIVAMFESPRLAFLVVLGMLAIQQLDSAIISPTIMRHTVNLHPVVIIFSLLVGGTLFGFLGLVLAIPFAAVVKALLLHYVYARPVEIGEEGSKGIGRA